MENKEEQQKKVFDKIDKTKEEITDQDIDVLCDWVLDEWEKLDKEQKQ